MRRRLGLRRWSLAGRGGTPPGMARLPRFDLPGIPQHVVQRGNNRLPCFLDDLDRQRYLQCLHHALGRFGCRLHAYVLMSNHVHLLLRRKRCQGQFLTASEGLG